MILFLDNLCNLWDVEKFAEMKSLKNTQKYIDF